MQLVYTTLSPEYKNAQLLRRITGWGGGEMQELVATDDIYMHAILYAYDFFCNNIFHSPLSPLRWLQNAPLKSEQWKTINYLNDQSNSPTCYISNAISYFTIIGQLHDGWNYRKLPKTMIFSKVRAMRRYWIYRMVETAPWEQKPHVIALESLQKVVLEALT